MFVLFLGHLQQNIHEFTMIVAFMHCFVLIIFIGELDALRQFFLFFFCIFFYFIYFLFFFLVLNFQVCIKSFLVF